MKKGAARKYLAQKDIKHIKIPVPPQNVQNRIIQSVENKDTMKLKMAGSRLKDLFVEYKQSVLAHAFQGKY